MGTRSNVRQLVVTVSERGREFLPHGAGEHPATFRVGTGREWTAAGPARMYLSVRCGGLVSAKCEVWLGEGNWLLDSVLEAYQVVILFRRLGANRVKRKQKE
jgi:hypothetical protein